MAFPKVSAFYSPRVGRLSASSGGDPKDCWCFWDCKLECWAAHLHDDYTQGWERFNYCWCHFGFLFWRRIWPPDAYKMCGCHPHNLMSIIVFNAFCRWPIFQSKIFNDPLAVVMILQHGNDIIVLKLGKWNVVIARNYNKLETYRILIWRSGWNSSRRIRFNSLGWIACRC